MKENENNPKPLTNVSVRLIGDSEFIEEFGRKATSGDYNHLLAVVSEYVNIE